jgi:hypothetical protein
MLYTINVKSVHKTLKLRHKKHTGKLLAHKHTSYRVLFLLMIVPIAMLAFVNHMEAYATDLTVSATVPAPIPLDPPTITTPQNGATVHSEDLVVAGTCPVIDPDVIITINDGSSVIGSVQCDDDGAYSVPVTLTAGQHTLIAKVVTITNGQGASSTPVTVTYIPPASPSPSITPDQTGIPSTTETIPESQVIHLPVQIVTKDWFVVIGSDGKVTWHGSFTGGTAPYNTEIDWGDGSVDKYVVNDQVEQAYSHTYQSFHTYSIIITATDATGDTTKLYNTAVTQVVEKRLAQDANLQQTAPIVAFIQENAIQIYVGALSGLVFLWYLEGGRHVIGLTKLFSALFHR